MRCVQSHKRISVLVGLVGQLIEMGLGVRQRESLIATVSKDLPGDVHDLRGQKRAVSMSEERHGAQYEYD